ncbi:MAG: hypothetical protein J4431_02175 [Candidatus Aenigmarchaeota archaeon]|nr:hypothetical protein [Candidatus Aenigmarchaeota archaeon]
MKLPAVFIAALLIAAVTPVSSASVIEGLNDSHVYSGMVKGGGNVYDILFTVTPAEGSGLPGIYVIENRGLLGNITAAYAATLAAIKETEGGITASGARMSALQEIISGLEARLQETKIRKEQMEAWKSSIDRERSSVEKGDGGLAVSAGQYNLILAAFAALLALMLLYRFFYKRPGDGKEELPQEYTASVKAAAPGQEESPSF